MSTKVKREARKITIKCDFATEVHNLFHHFSSQLSDGEWENSRPEYGSYGEGYYEDIWNCFDFEMKHDINNAWFVIILKAKPTWPEANEDCDKMHKWTDKEIADYLADAIIESIDNYRHAFFNYTDKELEVLIDSIKNWTILPPPLPKMTHEELVKLVGHDFEYIK